MVPCSCPHIETITLVPLDRFPDYKVSYRGELYKVVNGEDVLIYPNTANVEYPYWSLITTDGVIHLSCHRLMAETFLPNPDNLPVVDHLDGDKFNWQLSNLEWVTQSENILRAHAKGLMSHTTPIEKVVGICEDMSAGMRIKDIMKKYSVGRSVVLGIKYGKRHSRIGEAYTFPKRKTRQVS